MDGRHPLRTRSRAPISECMGVTLIELLLVCVLVAICASVAIPGFHRLVLDSRRTAQVNALLHALHAARSSAIMRQEPTVVCKSADQVQCTPGATSWSDGWIMFANRDHDSPPHVDPGEVLLLTQPAIENLAIRSSRSAVTYWPFALAGTTATFVFCDERGSSSARAIIVSQTGRPRVSERDSAGKALKCDGLSPN
jgi:type IV fimbrial biogenesis protein FimT